MTTATVNEAEKTLYIGTDTGHVLREAMSDEDLADYKAHPDAYFGKIVPVQKNLTTPYDLFAWLMDMYKTTPRDKLLEFVSNWPDFERLQQLSDEDLRVEYCERTAAAMVAKGTPV